jgi:hypothetical protein
MAGTDQNNDITKSFDLTKINSLTPEQKEKLSKIVSKQLDIQISVHEVYTVLMNIVNSDITEFLEKDDDGGYKLRTDIKDMDLEKRQQIKEISIDKTEYHNRNGELTRTNYKYKLKLHDKVKVLEHVQRYLDMWGDNRKGRSGSDRVNQFFSEVDEIIHNANSKGKIVDADVTG